MACLGALGIFGRAVFVIVLIVIVRAPFVDIADHVPQSIGAATRRKLIHRRGGADNKAGITSLALDEAVSPRVGERVGTPRRLFPLGFGGQSFAERLAIVRRCGPGNHGGGTFWIHNSR